MLGIDDDSPHIRRILAHDELDAQIMRLCERGNISSLKVEQIIGKYADILALSVNTP